MDMANAPRHHGQDGFTLVELIAVFVITGVMIAGAVYMFSSGKRTAGRSQAVSTARIYHSAIEQFATDHSGVVPSEIGRTRPTTGAPVADWPDPQAGPFSRLARADGKYIRRVPEPVISGEVGIGAVAGSRSRIEYIRRSDTDFELRITMAADQSYLCSYGTNLPAQARSCSKTF